MLEKHFKTVAALIGVCLVLVLWTTGSCSPAGLPARSPDSGSAWDRAYPDISANILRYRKAGDLRSAELAYQRGFERAVQRGDNFAAVRFEIGVGGCRLGLSEYRAAVAVLLDARERANALGDIVDLGAIAGNLSSVYLQMWDIPAAFRAAEEGLAAGASAPSAYFMPPLLLQLGRLHALENDGRAESFFWQGIEAARRRGDTDHEAQGWDSIGDDQFARGGIANAEKSYLEAYRLRLLNKSAELGFSYGRLGAVRLAQERLDEADRLTQLAAEAGRQGKPSWPAYLMKHQQGSIHLARGETAAALEDFSRAIEATAAWRLQALPARSSLATSNAGLEQKIFRSFIELAASQAVQTHNFSWATRGFLALELNRAASLRESRALADGWRQKLPPEYWETLGKLEAAQAKALQTGRPNEVVGSLRLKITEMEAAAGVRSAVKKDENFRIQSSLNHFRAGLGETELFLTFLLGKDSSYVWAVSRESVNLYKLPPETEIAAETKTFREAVLSGGGEVERSGRRLYQDLFRSLNSRERAKQKWLLSLEDVLFEVPFAALVESRAGKSMYLVERHSIQVVPGALMLAKDARPSRRDGWLLGVGDPIYNTADARWGPLQPEGASIMGSLWAKSAPAQLVRLVASGDEVHLSAASWQARSGTATVLEGFQAARDLFLDQVGRGPQVIHLATHVLFPDAQLADSGHEQALVAFSISRNAPLEGPQYLSTMRISTLSVPGALVVMTGCAAGAGDARAGVGLLGLTRAWLMAGASGVLATAWAVEDSPGEMFSRFYRYYPDTSAAEALRRTQVEMLHHTPPARWAAYQFTGGLH